MMRYWDRRRRVSFAVHTAFVAVPFGAATVSSLLFWRAMFGSVEFAVMMVAAVEVLALTGLVLHVAHIVSPFAWLRHLLPFISIGPLGYELYLALAHNGLAPALALTAIVTGIFVYIARQCFVTIERLFIDPVAAARERAHEQIEHLNTEIAALYEKNAAVNEFVREWIEARGVSIPYHTEADAVSAPPQLAIDATYTCMRCKAVHPVPAGKNAASVQAVSGRWGCRACKENER